MHGDISSTGFSRKLNFSSFSPNGHSFKRCVVRVIKEIIEILNPKPIKSLCHTKLEVILQITSVPHTKKNCFCFCLQKYILRKLKKEPLLLLLKVQDFQSLQIHSNIFSYLGYSTNEINVYDMPLHPT